MLKKITRINWVQNVIVRILYCILVAVKNLSSWRHLNSKILTKASSQKKPLIILLWHNQVIGVTYGWNIKKKVYNIVTDHPDGTLSAKFHELLGFDSIVRSSKKPTNILRELIKIGKKNECIFITPDGPHGPKHQINGKIYNLVKKINANVICLSFITNNKLILNTWDKLMVPYPFSKGHYYFSEIIDYQKFNEEDFNKEIKNKLNEGIDKIYEHHNL